MLEHGGRLHAAAKRYGIALEQWLDLSTGINPEGWPVPAIPPQIWSRLPEEDDGLEAAAEEYYGARLLPVAGSQAAIQALPFLRKPSRVGVITPGYAEHAHAWTGRGHTVTAVAASEVGAAVDGVDVMILINPNNPTGGRFSVAQLLGLQARLAARGGWLVVDEAFMDTTPVESLLPFAPLPGLVVLRSLGKFFGLAGLRMGFVCAEPELTTRLRNHLGPWPVAAASRWIATAALRDQAWQDRTRQALSVRSMRLAGLLRQCGLAPSGGTALFQWVRTGQARGLHDRLAARGIFTRLFEAPASLRFGLPASESDWKRLAAALHEGMQ